MRIFAFLAGMAVVVVFVFFSPNIFKNNPAKASYWIPKVFAYQDQLLEKRDDRPKLVIIAGSNGLYGFDGEYLEKYTNFDVVNMAVHAALDLDIYKNRLDGKLKRGDLVIAPIEHMIYRRDKTTYFHFKQNLLWLQRFSDYDSLWERLAYNMKAPMEIYGELGWNKMTGKIRNLENLATLNNDGIKKPYVLPKNKPLHVSLADRHGFFNMPLARSAYTTKLFERKKSPYSNLPEKAASGTKAVISLQELKRSVEAQGAKFYVTWPAMSDVPSHSKDDKKLVGGYRKFQAKMGESGIKMICDPATMFIPPKYFSDTVYHVNSWGAIYRSIQLLQCLKRVGDNRYQIEPLVDTHTVENHMFIRNSRTMMLAPFEVAQRDLAKVQKALEAYFKDHGAYPKSSNDGLGWDGLHSKWGESSKEWIKGLVPKYIDELPIDWRKTNSINYQYLYRSNGKVYKMMDRRPVDCELAKTFVPEFMDVSRDCWAYGVYHGYARTW